MTSAEDLENLAWLYRLLADESEKTDLDTEAFLNRARSRLAGCPIELPGDVFQGLRRAGQSGAELENFAAGARAAADALDARAARLRETS
jgi:hypothetical protein